MKIRDNFYHKGKNFALFITLFVFSVLFTACDENKSTVVTPTPYNDNIVEYINENSNFSLLAQIIEGSTLENTLSASTNHTILAPTNAAFAKLPEEYLDDLTDSQKMEILRYHILSGSVQINNNAYSEKLTSLQGDELFVTVDESGARVNNSAVITSKNQTVSNGIVHAVDELLLPDGYGTIIDNVRKRYEYDILYRMLEELNVIELLDSDGPISFIVPPVDIINDIDTWLGMPLENDQKKEIWNYNIVREDITGIGSGTQLALKTEMGDSLYVSMIEPGEYLFNQYISTTPSQKVIKSSNGTIYLTHGLAIPDKYLGVLTVMDKRHYLQTVRSAFAVAKMTGRMYNSENNADEQFTVFIPKNNASGINGLPSEQDDLADLLKYHVLLEKVTTDQLQHNQTYTTWQGEEITITRNGDVITINGTATIRIADLEGKNGVVHVIDAVLDP